MTVSSTQGEKWLLIQMPSDRKGDLRWFSFTQRVHVSPSAIERMNFQESTYLETTAKINEVIGSKTILIVDSAVGSVKASTVVLCHSKAQTIEADFIYLFQSRVQGDMVAKRIEQDLKQIWPKVTPKPQSILSFLELTNISEEKTGGGRASKPKLKLFIYPNR